jgi:hypothetical protein
MTAMITLAILCVVVATGVFLAAPAYGPAVLFGMLGPFAAVFGTWLLVERVARTNPGGLTALIMTGFVVKMVFFALYVVAVVRLAGVDWTAFAISFATAFIAMYAVEALLLRRLVARLT